MLRQHTETVDKDLQKANRALQKSKKARVSITMPYPKKKLPPLSPVIPRICFHITAVLKGNSILTGVQLTLTLKGKFVMFNTRIISAKYVFFVGVRDVNPGK